MSTSLHLFRRAIFSDTKDVREGVRLANSTMLQASAQFAREQVRGLVQRLFVPGSPRSNRQVVFSSVDADTDVSFVCRLVAEALTDCAAKVCLVEAKGRANGPDQDFGRTRNNGGDVPIHSRAKRTSSREASQNLFLVAADYLFSPNPGAISIRPTQDALTELREEFDFSIIHGDCAGTSSSTLHLGRLVDGIVLGVTANRTRKAVAQKIQEQLVSANIRVLGIVLCERTFPIPEMLYRRL